MFHRLHSTIFNFRQVFNVIEHTGFKFILFLDLSPGYTLSPQFDFARPGTASNLLRQSVVKQEMSILQGVRLFKLIFFQDVIDYILNFQRISIICYTQPPPHASLDFAKIKRSFEEGDEKTVCYLLQAVRWRLTKVGPHTSSKPNPKLYLSFEK